MFAGESPKVSLHFGCKVTGEAPTTEQTATSADVCFQQFGTFQARRLQETQLVRVVGRRTLRRRTTGGSEGPAGGLWLLLLLEQLEELNQHPNQQRRICDIPESTQNGSTRSRHDVVLCTSNYFALNWENIKWAPTKVLTDAGLSECPSLRIRLGF